MKPYTSAVDRARELYLLPTCPAPHRALELGCGREPLYSPATWPGESYTHWAFTGSSRGDGPTLPFGREAFDLIILHRTLDDLAARHGRTFDARGFLQSLAALLAPGGAIAGCVGNKTSPLRWLHGGTDEASSAFLSLRGCRRLLASAGFTDIRLFNLLPGCQSPLRLIEHDAAVTRVAFRREFQDAWRDAAAPRQWARSFALAFGLVPHLESTMFFWSGKPC